MAFVVTSPSFTDGGALPGLDGTGASAGTQSCAVIVDDPHAPAVTPTHPARCGIGAEAEAIGIYEDRGI